MYGTKLPKSESSEYDGECDRARLFFFFLPPPPRYAAGDKDRELTSDTDAV
jgi:hypothetical protein